MARIDALALDASLDAGDYLGLTLCGLLLRRLLLLMIIGLLADLCLKGSCHGQVYF